VKCERVIGRLDAQAADSLNHLLALATGLAD
jgi:hypothetical protein